MRGLTPQISSPMSSIDCIMALKKKPDTRGVTPSLLSICYIPIHTVFAWSNFLTTSGQSSSVAEITHPRYLKEVTISRGAPVGAESPEGDLPLPLRC